MPPNDLQKRWKWEEPPGSGAAPALPARLPAATWAQQGVPSVCPSVCRRCERGGRTRAGGRGPAHPSPGRPGPRLCICAHAGAALPLSCAFNKRRLDLSLTVGPSGAPLCHGAAQLLGASDTSLSGSARKAGGSIFSESRDSRRTFASALFTRTAPRGAKVLTPGEGTGDGGTAGEAAPGHLLLPGLFQQRRRHLTSLTFCLALWRVLLISLTSPLGDPQGRTPCVKSKEMETEGTS